MNICINFKKSDHLGKEVLKCEPNLNRVKIKFVFLES